MERTNDSQRIELVRTMRETTDEMGRTAIAAQTRILRQHGLTVLQALVLRAVACEDRALDMARIAELTALPPSTLTSVTDRLEERGLAHRQSHPVDRRKVTVVVTPDGRALIGELERLSDQLMLELIADIPVEDVQATIEVAKRITATLATVDLVAFAAAHVKP